MPTIEYDGGPHIGGVLPILHSSGQAGTLSMARDVRERKVTPSLSFWKGEN
jgi:hypothetical protein